MSTDLTKEAMAGQLTARGTEAPHYFSSPAWLGFMASRALVETSPIRKARMGRGFAVNVETEDGERFIVRFIGRNLDSTQILRL